MNDEDFSYSPADEQSITRQHNARLEEESYFEHARRTSGSFAEAQNRLAKALDRLTSLAERQNGRGL